MTTPRSLDVDLGHGRTLRVTRAADELGESIVFASGFAGGDSGRAFHRPSWCGTPLAVPASALPQLVAALEELSS